MRLGQLGDERIHVPAAAPVHALRIHLTGSRPVRLVVGGGEGKMITESQTVVSRVDAWTDVSLEDARASDGVPTLRIAYYAPAENKEKTALLTDKEVEELEALGYLK